MTPDAGPHGWTCGSANNVMRDTHRTAVALICRMSLKHSNDGFTVISSVEVMTVQCG